MFLENKTVQEIADAIGCGEHTVRMHIEKDLRPIWSKFTDVNIGTELARVAMLEAKAWDLFNEGKIQCWQIIKFCLEHRASLVGLFYRPNASHAVEITEIRVAGVDREQLAAHLLAQVEAAKARAAAINVRVGELTGPDHHVSVTTATCSELVESHSNITTDKK